MESTVTIDSKTLNLIIGKLSFLEDEGPIGEGGQSKELQNLIEHLESKKSESWKNDRSVRSPRNGGKSR